ncbi:MAG: cytochrome c3 family protein [Longimicrobiales bacterium]|nr:cytochrome c3 family protein [Longimicrobiales bacterium]
MAKGNRALIPAMTMVLVALAGCVDEQVVFEDRGIYDRIPEEALGFVGYADPSDGDKLTVCGYCHGDYQSDWEGTAHSMAWEGLQSSDHARAFCEACHTVNSLGNVAMEDSAGAVGGHLTPGIEPGRYFDVQCESCHGPGLVHASDPADANVPLAPVNVGPSLSAGCGECHSGLHHPFVEEWSRSPHANVTPAAALRGPLEGGCASCHTGEGALVRLGVRADYLEQDSLAGDDVYMQITCAVCHDPHSARHEGQLRFPSTVTAIEQHICAQCHDRQSQPDTQGNQEWLQPHSAETDVLAGTAGWFPGTGSVTPGQITGPHGVGSNPRACASCHVVGYTNQTESGTFFSVGHGFRAAPCVGPNGLPTGETGCALTTTARSFQGCADGGCHDSPDDALTKLDDALDRIIGYAVQLDGYLDDLGSEINPDDGRFTVAEGALFNFRLATTRTGFRSNQTTAERRRALAATVTHNAPFIEALLIETLAAVEAAYPAVAADPALSGLGPGS